MSVKTNYLICILIFILLGYRAGFAQNNSATLTIISSELSENDTLELHIWSDIFGFPYSYGHKVLVSNLDQGKAIFEINNITDVCWLSANFSYQKARLVPAFGIFDMLPIAADDDITINLTKQGGRYQNFETGYDNGEPIFENNWKCHFSGGRPAKRMQMAYEATTFFDQAKEEHYVGSSFEEVLGYFKVLEEEFLFKLKDNDAELSIHDKTLLELDGLSKIRLEKLAYLDRKKSSINSREIGIAMDSLVKWRTDIADMYRANLKIKLSSPRFIDYCADLMYVSARYSKKEEILKVAVEFADVHIEDKDLKDRVWTQLLVENFYTLASQHLLNQVLSEMKFVEGRTLLTSFKVLVDGRTQLDFSLPDITGKIHQLKDYRGKVVLIDFWYMGCIPCRGYVKNVLTPLMDGKRQLGDFELIMVSVDNKSDFTKALDSGIIPKGAVNLFTDNQRFKHSVIQDLGIRSFPYPLLIDKNGVVVGRGDELKEMNELVTKIKVNK